MTTGRPVAPPTPPGPSGTTPSQPFDLQVSLLPDDGDTACQPFQLQFPYTARRFILTTHGTSYVPGPRPHWELAATPFAALAMTQRFRVHGRTDRFNALVASAVASSIELKTPSSTHPEPLREPLDGIPAPWPHQRYATHWLDRRLRLPGSGAFLYLGLGTGKTRVVLDWLAARDIRRTVVVTPRAVLPVWADEARKWWPDHFEVYTVGASSTVRRRWEFLLSSRVLETRKPLIIVANYDSIWREPFSQLLTNEFGIEAVVADECHRLKGRSSERSRFFRHMWRRIPYRVALSGTPLSNGQLTDAYGQFAFLDPGIFGLSIQRFEDRYAIKRNWMVLGWKNTEEFYQRFWWITHHEDRSVLTLPPLQEIEKEIDLPTEAKKLYREMKEEALINFRDQIVTAQNAVVIISKLQQIASGRVITGTDDARTVLQIHDEKKQALISIFEETGAEPVVVFCLFKEDLRQVHEAAREVGIESMEVSGARQQYEEWKNGNCPILAVQIQSGSEGISLVKAQLGIFFSPSHSLAQMEQAKARLHRPGQSSSVTLIHLIARNTIDVLMHKALRKKQNFIQALVDSKGGLLDELDNDLPF